ncbi:MAG: orc1/cdc6 family replication initiation protein [Nitrososphaerota archaeon]
MKRHALQIDNHKNTIVYRKHGGGRDPLDEVIENLSSRRTAVILRPDFLRADYIPQELPHRTEQIRALGRSLSPCLRGAKPSNIFVYGKTGTGKTAVCRYVFGRFGHEVAERGELVRFSYVNCRLAGTEYRVLTEMCSAVGVSVPFTGLSKSEVFNRLTDSMGRLGISLIVCLDEIDVLVKSYGDNLLYELTRGFMGSSWVTIVGISNDLMFKERLDPRVLSSLSEEELVFPPYTAAELADILRERVALAMRPGSVNAGVVGLCAALAAAEHGDARRALDLLRVSAEIAERSGSTTVGEIHVRQAQVAIERGRVQEVLSSLPLHSRLVVLAVMRAKGGGDGHIPSGSLYTTYRDLCNRIGVDPLTDRRVSTLVSELDMLGLVSCDLISYGRHGRTRKTRLTIDPAEVKAIFRKDELLSSLLEELPS